MHGSNRQSGGAFRAICHARWSLVLAMMILMLLPAGGCRPLAANIELRRQNQELRSRIVELRRMREADIAHIRALEERAEVSPTLPQQRLERMFTVHGMRFGRLTGGANLDPQAPGDEALRIHVVPTDEMGQPLKAAGSFIVEAFDLEQSHEPLLGRWRFSPEEARQSWYGTAMLYTYVLICPWQEVVPESEELTIRVTFRDLLTGRTFTEQRIVRINPPGVAADRTITASPR